MNGIAPGAMSPGLAHGYAMTHSPELPMTAYPHRESIPTPPRSSSFSPAGLPPPKDSLTLQGEKRKRNPLACDACRSKKAKCDGEQPVCSNCANRGTPCVYRAFQRKAQRTEQYVQELESRLARYEATLPPDPSTSPHFEGGHGLDALSSAASYVHAKQRDTNWGEESDEQSGEGAAADGMGVPGDRDNSVFFGGSAISTVFKSIRPSINNANPPDTVSPASQGHSRSATSPLPPTLAMQDDAGLPPRTLADALLSAYWHYVHTLYPFLDERSYRQLYARFWSDNAAEIDPIEQGILNLKFALGAHFLGDKLRPTEAVALGARFFKRARDVMGVRLMSVGTMRCVQALLLMGQYAQSTNQPNFCWNVIGLAVRVAQGLGLHLEASDDLRLTDEERELRRRTFWICFVMDRMVSLTFGRPTSIREDMVSVNLPSVTRTIGICPEDTMDKDQPDLILFFTATVKLSRLQSAVLDALYAQTGVLAATNVPLTRILELDADLEDFEENLPIFLRATTPNERIPWPFINRQRNVLRQRALNIRLLLHRPCLLYHLQSGEAHSPVTDLNMARQVFKSSAGICLEAARQAIDIAHKTHQDRNLSGASWYSTYYTFQGCLCLLLLRYHIDSGKPCEIDFTEKDEVALEKATEVLEHLSSKSSTAAACWHHVLAASHRSRHPMPPPATLPTSVRATNPPYPSYSTFPAVGLNGLFPNAQITNDNWSLESLFTSAALPAHFEQQQQTPTPSMGYHYPLASSASNGQPTWTTWPVFEMT